MISQANNNWYLVLLLGSREMVLTIQKSMVLISFEPYQAFGVKDHLCSGVWGEGLWAVGSASDFGPKGPRFDPCPGRHLLWP